MVFGFKVWDGCLRRAFSWPADLPLGWDEPTQSGHCVVEESLGSSEPNPGTYYSGLSPPGNLVRMKCEHVCAWGCFNQRKTGQGLYRIPCSLCQTWRTIECIWPKEETLRPTGNRLAQSTFPALAKMQFSRRPSFTSLPCAGQGAQQSNNCRLSYHRQVPGAA